MNYTATILQAKENWENQIFDSQADWESAGYVHQNSLLHGQGN